MGESYDEGSEVCDCGGPDWGEALNGAGADGAGLECVNGGGRVGGAAKPERHWKNVITAERKISRWRMGNMTVI